MNNNGPYESTPLFVLIFNFFQGIRNVSTGKPFSNQSGQIDYALEYPKLPKHSIVYRKK